MFASKRLREWAWATVVTVVLALTITTVAVVVAPTAAASLNELNLQDDVPGGALRIFGVSRVMSRSVFPVVEGANGGGHDGNDGGDATTGDESVGGVLMGLPNSTHASMLDISPCSLCLTCFLYVFYFEGLKLVLLVIIFGILVLAIISCCRGVFSFCIPLPCKY